MYLDFYAFYVFQYFHAVHSEAFSQIMQLANKLAAPVGFGLDVINFNDGATTFVTGQHLSVWQFVRMWPANPASNFRDALRELYFSWRGLCN